MNRLSSHLLAFPLVTAVMAVVGQGLDVRIMAKMHAMSPEAYVSHQDTLLTHSWFYHFISIGFLGALYLAAVEGVAWLIRRSFRKGAAPAGAVIPTG